MIGSDTMDEFIALKKQFQQSAAIVSLGSIGVASVQDGGIQRNVFSVQGLE